MGCDSIQQCNYIQICFWGENKVFQEIIFWTDLTYLLQVQENVCDTLLLLVLFSINVSGDGNSPLPSQRARPDGAAWPKKQKRVWPPPIPLPLPPASAYITVWTPVQVESLRLDLARRYLLQSLSEGTPQGQPVYLGMNENKGVRRIVFSITS